MRKVFWNGWVSYFRSVRVGKMPIRFSVDLCAWTLESRTWWFSVSKEHSPYGQIKKIIHSIISFLSIFVLKFHIRKKNIKKNIKKKVIDLMKEIFRLRVVLGMFFFVEDEVKSLYRLDYAPHPPWTPSTSLKLTSGV